MVLYADIYLLINFSMDFLSLFITSKLLNMKIIKHRIILSSIIGAIYALVMLLLELTPIVSFVVNLMCEIILVLVSFDTKKIKKIISLSLVNFVTSATLGGTMSILYSFMNKLMENIVLNETVKDSYFGIRMIIIVTLTLLTSIVFSRILNRSKQTKSEKIKIKLNQNIFEIEALCDSGNLLKEPISGKCVILVTEKSDLGKNIMKIQDIYKRYIPYKNVEGTGILKGVIPQKIIVRENLVDAIVATAEIDSFGGYEALLPTVLL